MRLLILFLCLVSFLTGYGQDIDVENDIIEEVVPKILKEKKDKSLTISAFTGKKLPENIEQYNVITIKDYERPGSIDLKLFFHNSLEELTIIGFGVLGKAESIPTGIKNAKNLKKLTFVGQKLKYLPAEIGYLSQLETLDIYGNQWLKKLPKEIGKLKKLKYLRVDSFSLEHIPDEIGELPNLEYLILNPESQSNKLSSLPESVGNLKALKELDVHSYQLSTVPEGISGLTALKKMNLEGNFMKLPADFSNLKNLEDLRIYSNELIDIPKGLENLRNLKKLRLVCGSIEGSTLNIGKLPNLRSMSIDIRKDEVLKFNDGVSKSLTNLYISGNRLLNIEGLKNFENLTTLGITYAALQQVPHEVFGFKELIRFKMSKTQLTSIPKGLSQNTNLKYIVFTDNKILGKIPKELLKLPNLKSVSLARNGEITNVAEIRKRASFEIYY